MGKLQLYCQKCRKKSKSSGKTFMNIKSRNIFFQKRDSPEDIVVLEKNAMKLRALPKSISTVLNVREK